MREDELRRAATCRVCRRPFGALGLPIFWRLRIARLGLDHAKVRRQDGLAAMLGSPALARVMGPDEDLTVPLGDPVEITVCEACASHRSASIYELALTEAEDDEAPESAEGPS